MATMEELKQEEERRKRFLLEVHDNVKVYSRSAKKWLNGRIKRIFVDAQTNQEWFIVKYGNNKTKKMQRFCADLQSAEINQNTYHMKENNENDLSDLETDDRNSPISSYNTYNTSKSQNVSSIHPNVFVNTNDNIFSITDDMDNSTLDKMSTLQLK
eukprot:226726_1